LLEISINISNVFFDIYIYIYIYLLCTRRSLAAAIVDDTVPGDFNQALMELGATVCTPTAPKCDQCPVASICLGNALATSNPRKRMKLADPIVNIEECHICLKESDGDDWAVTFYPRKEKKKSRNESANVYIVEHPDGRLLLQRNGEKGLLAGLWDFIVMIGESASDVGGSNVNIASEAIDVDDVDNNTVVLANSIQDTLVSLGLPVKGSPTTVGTVAHVFTHIKQSLLVHRVCLEDASINTELEPNQKWVKVEEIESGSIAVSKRARKCLEARQMSLQQASKPPKPQGKQKTLDLFFKK
jgi:A/G-specific adenine glycosylase